MISHEFIARLAQNSRDHDLYLTHSRSKERAGGAVALASRNPAGDLPLGLELESSHGTCWRIDRAVAELWPEQERWLTALAKRTASSKAEAPHPELTALAAALPDDALLLNIKTRGGDSPYVFLAGAVHTCQGLPMVTQLLARDAHEEAAVLAMLDGLADGKQCLVTFNGKSFAGPVLEERRRVHALRSGVWQTLVHCDLIHHARRRWKDRFPNCKLHTLEQYVCGRQRNENDPQRDIDAAYDAFLQQASCQLLLEALRHHALDLITEWQLGLWLAHAW